MRLLKYGIFYFIFVFLLSFFFFSSLDVFALNSGYSSGSYYTAFSNCGSSGRGCAVGWGSWQGPQNFGTNIINPITAPNIGLQTRYQWRFVGGSIYTYYKGNTYNVKIKFRTTYNDVDVLRTFWKVDHMYGSTTGSSSSQSESYIKSFNYILYEDTDLSTTNTYILEVNFVPERNINYFSIYYSLLSNTASYVSNYGVMGNIITYTNIPITYIEKEDIEINDTIQEQTNVINNNFNNLSSLIEFTNQQLQNIQNNTNQSIKDMNSNMTDSSIDNNSGNDFFDNVDVNQHGISGLITLPLQFINQFQTATCSPFDLDILGTNVNVPCLSNLEKNVLGNELYNIIVVCVNAPIVMGIINYFIKSIKNANNPNDDRIEVVDL